MNRSASTKVSDLEAHLGFWLRFVSNYVSDRFRRLLEDEGTTVTEWVALRCLFAREQTTHAELIAALSMTKSAASKVVSRLEEKGLALRQLAEGRSREQVLVLTKTGAALVPRLAALADRNEEHCFGHLGLRQRKELTQVFRGLVTHHQLKEIPTE
jgi:DNA-binding MarR family transcriptional regulator